MRVTVYLRKPEDGTQAAFRYERQGELGLFYWVEAGLGYALVGALAEGTAAGAGAVHLPAALRRRQQPRGRRSAPGS